MSGKISHAILTSSLALVALLVPGGGASAAIVSLSGNIVELGSPPANTNQGQNENDALTIFLERSAIALVDLGGALPTPGPDLSTSFPAGSFTLNSYYVSWDPVGTDLGENSGTATVTFSPGETVVAVYGLNGTINGNTAAYTGLSAPGTVYPTTNRGLENTGELPTAASLGTGTLNINSLAVGGANIDQFRVVTAVIPEPSVAWLLAGSVAVVLGRRRRG